jgi:hypothetical protein
MIFATKTIENFLSADEITEIEAMINAGMAGFMVDFPESAREELNDKGIDRVANILNLPIYNDTHTRLNEILLPKLQEHFHKDIFIDDCHILESHSPYRVHTDATDDDAENYTIKPAAGMIPAWTFIIPLDTYNSNTIIFDQSSSKYKGPEIWVEKTNPPLLNSIDEETYNKYFINMASPIVLKYFSIEEIFPWKKGNLSAAAREKFHCSDNFLKNGVKQKRAIVMWTTIPKKS